MTRLPQSYLVCASQRSGSTLLVESLKATGVAGRPEEFFQYLPQTGLAPQPRQWFADVTDQSILSLLAPLVPGAPDARDATQWRADLLDAGRTPNGVWGGKLMWNQTPLLLERAAELPARSGMDLRAAIADVLGDVAFVWVRRPDVVPQAVSMWRAVQTQVWRDDPSGTEDDGAQKDRRSTTPAESHTSPRSCRARTPHGSGGSPTRASNRSRSTFRRWRRIRRAPSPACWNGSGSTRNWPRRRRFGDRATPDPPNGSSATAPTPQRTDTPS